MRKLFGILTVLVAIMLLAASCSKEGVSWFKGSYSFTLGGTISVCPADDEFGDEYEDESEYEEDEENEDEEEDESEADGLSVINLTPEKGQMHILTADRSSGSMIVTMSTTGGAMLVFDAVVKGKTLTIIPFTRHISINLTNSNSSSEILRPSAEVEVSGSGRRYEDVLIFDLKYKGGYSVAGKEYEITKSKIECVATLNK